MGRSRSGDSAWISAGRPASCIRARGAERPSRGIGGNSPTPESAMNILKPHTPSPASGRMSGIDPGTTPPQKATSTESFPSAAVRFLASASTLVVGGMLFSGMSTMVVAPPAAAAIVAVAKPSQSLRPGSLTWTCVSTRPGRTMRSPKSRSAGPSTIWTITPSSYLIAEGRNSPSITTRDDLMLGTLAR